MSAISRRTFLQDCVSFGLPALTAGFAFTSAAMPSALAYAEQLSTEPMRAPVKRPPNFIIVNADDLGYGDLGCYGSAIQTPALDGMAREGARFTDFYACSPVCSPSRYGLLTGRYPARIDLNLALFPSDTPWKLKFSESFYHFLGTLGLLDLGNPGSARGIPAEDVTLAEALKQKRYRTCLIGKWHLGDKPEHHPNANGFDHFYGTPYSNDMIPFPLFRNNEKLEENIADQSALTGRYTEEALAFIERSGNDPFFLYFAHTFPHIPLHASENFRGKSRAGLYGDTVEELDWSVGQLLDKLKQMGIDNDTLVIFTSDNGPWFEGSPGSLRGGKGMTFEGGFRVPMIARWPARIPANIVCREPAMNLDIFPTCLALAHAGPPVQQIDGKNILHLLQGEGASPHKAIFFYRCDEVEAVRAGKWKYHRRRNVYVWPSNLQKKGPLLFDLESDPNERYDVSATYPDIATNMENLIVRWENDMRRGHL